MKWMTTMVLFYLSFVLIACNESYRSEPIDPPTIEKEAEIKEIYSKAKLSKTIPFDLFRMGMIGLDNINRSKKTDQLVLIDFSKPSTEERFYVIDLKEKKLLYKCFVAHGKNSGGKKATKFSNVPESKKSSLGFYLTAETYNGKHGYSMRLDGLEKGINDNARKRAIVMHNAAYVSKAFIKKNGTLGRSWGCPALPIELSEAIIKKIAGGSCLFIYANDATYLSESNYILKN